MGKSFGVICAESCCFATNQGEGTLEELASRFLVSVGWAKRFLPRATALVRRASASQAGA